MAGGGSQMGEADIPFRAKQGESIGGSVPGKARRRNVW